MVKFGGGAPAIIFRKKSKKPVFATNVCDSVFDNCFSLLTSCKLHKMLWNDKISIGTHSRLAQKWCWNDRYIQIWPLEIWVLTNTNFYQMPSLSKINSGDAMEAFIHETIGQSTRCRDLIECPLCEKPMTYGSWKFQHIRYVNSWSFFFEIRRERTICMGWFCS